MAINSEVWLQAQYSVLGAALIEPKVIPRVIHETTEADFSAANLTVYQAIRRLFLEGRAVDPVSVAGILGKDYNSYLMQLMQITPTAANIGSYISLCHEQARVNQVKALAARIGETESWEKISELIEEAGKLNVSKPGLKITTMEEGLRSFMDRHSKGRAEYLTWPVPQLNDVLYCEPGDFVIIGGYPSSGKTAWSLQCAWHWAQKYRVGYFSFETTAAKLFDRQMAAAASIGMGDIKRNQIPQEAWDRLAVQSTEILSRKLELVPAAGMTPADIRAVTINRQYQIILVDYAQLIQGKGENRTAIVTAVSIALHTLAQSLGVTVVALSQLTRPNKDQKGRAPDMSDLRESGQLEQDADLIMMLSMSGGDNPNGDRDLRIRKNKEGTCPNIRLSFDGMHQRFRKADSSGEVASHYAAEGRQKRRENARKSKEEIDGQLPLLPGNEPVPF